MAATYVQSISGHHASGTGNSVTFPSAVTAGNVLLAGVDWNTAAGSATVTDSQGNTWHPVTGSLKNDAGLTASTQWFWTVASATGTGEVVTSVDPSSAQSDLHLFEFSGLDIATPVDAAGTGAGTSGTPTATLTTTAADEVVLILAVDVGTLATASGYTSRTRSGVSQTDQKNTPTALGSVSAVTGDTSSGGWVASAIALKAAASSPSFHGAPSTTSATSSTAAGHKGAHDAVTYPPTAFPIVSRGVPVTDSAGFGGTNAAANAVDSAYGSVWRSVTSPNGASAQWLTLDLRGVAAGDKTDVWAVLKNQTRPAYQPAPAPLGTDPASEFQHLARDYKLQGHASSGAQPAVGDAGWTDLVTVTDNRRAERIHTGLDLSAVNWFRIWVTAASGVSGNDDVSLEVDLRNAAPTGATDDSIFVYGDSISMEAWGLARVDGAAWDTGGIPEMLEAQLGRPTPAIQDASTGGWTASIANTNKADYIDTPARYVVLSFGRNDANSANGDLNSVGGASSAYALQYKADMQALIDYVEGLGKTAIVPKITYGNDVAWADPDIQILNGKIDELLAENPGVIPGPDFYTFYAAHPTLLRDGKHPTWDPATGTLGGLTGYDEMHQLWVDTLASAVYDPPAVRTSTAATGHASSTPAFSGSASTSSTTSTTAAGHKGAHHAASTSSSTGSTASGHQTAGTAFSGSATTSTVTASTPSGRKGAHGASTTTSTTGSVVALPVAAKPALMALALQPRATLGISTQPGAIITITIE